MNMLLCLKHAGTSTVTGEAEDIRLSSHVHLHSMNQRRIWSWRFSWMSGPSINFRLSLTVTKASL